VNVRGSKLVVPNYEGPDKTTRCIGGNAWWHDVDASDNHCRGVGFEYMLSGESGVGEYSTDGPSGQYPYNIKNGGSFNTWNDFGYIECCGDDSGEFIKQRTIGGYVYKRCCNSNSDSLDGDARCSGYNGNGFSFIVGSRTDTCFEPCPPGYACIDSSCVSMTGSCMDEDGGIDLYDIENNKCHDASGSKTDYCMNDDRDHLFEYYCTNPSSGYCETSKEYCPIGCWGGACITCEDSDHGEDMNIRGVCYDSDHPNGMEDYCNNGNVYDYHCSEGASGGSCIASQGTSCPAGTQCMDGGCIGNDPDPTEPLEKPNHFTVVVLPDTQNYPAYFPDTFSIQTEWIRDHVDDLNIKFVIHVGDIVNSGGAQREWTNANESMSLLDGVVPYLLILGNHDYDKRNNYVLSENYNKYFPHSRFEYYDWYGGHYPSDKNNNNYGFFSVGGIEFMVMGIEWDPSNTIMAWANNTIGDNSEKSVILFTHYYMSLGSSRSNIGNSIWNKVVRHNPNVIIVHNGHHGVALRTDYIGENPVHQIGQNYQSLMIDGVQHGGDGWLRYYIFKPEQNKIEAKTYSPQYREYNNSGENHFHLDYFSDVDCNPNGTNGNGTCDLNCGASNWCHGKYPGINICNTLCQEDMPDLDNDGDVDIDDIIMVILEFGKTTDFNPVVDIDGNGVIDIFDVVFIAGRFT
jgi:hypothetical protein